MNKDCTQKATKESQLSGEEWVTPCQSWTQIQLGDSTQGQSRNNWLSSQHLSSGVPLGSIQTVALFNVLIEVLLEKLDL